MTDTNPHLLYLRRLKDTHKWKQAQIAEALGTTRGAVTHWIKGNREPSGEVKAKLEALAIANGHGWPPERERKRCPVSGVILKEDWEPGVFMLDYYWVHQHAGQFNNHNYNSVQLVAHQMVRFLCDARLAGSDAEAYKVLLPIMETHFRESWRLGVIYDEILAKDSERMPKVYNKAGVCVGWEDSKEVLAAWREKYDYDPTCRVRWDIRKYAKDRLFPNRADPDHPDMLAEFRWDVRWGPLFRHEGVNPDWYPGEWVGGEWRRDRSRFGIGPVEL